MNSANLSRMLDNGWTVTIRRGVLNAGGPGYAAAAEHVSGAVPAPAAKRIRDTILRAFPDDQAETAEAIAEIELEDGILVTDHPTDPMRALELLAAKVLGEYGGGDTCG